jgi:hypothetical protein
MRVEILLDGSKEAPMNPRGEDMLRAMIESAPNGCVVTKQYTGSCDYLMLYGAGLHTRREAMRKHRGHTIIWDIGYFDKINGGMRLAINTLHPTVQQLDASPTDTRFPQQLRLDADQSGPILLIGMGKKSAPLYGLQPLSWERDKLLALQGRFPGRRIEWRPKGRVPMRLLGAPLRHGGEIADALKGVSLVVCRHSNVAVDACLAGVPVECEDGAARWLYRHGTAPAPAARAEFLARLSWWNYNPTQAADAWSFIARMTK